MWPLWRRDHLNFEITSDIGSKTLATDEHNGIKTGNKYLVIDIGHWWRRSVLDRVTWYQLGSEWHARWRSWLLICHQRYLTVQSKITSFLFLFQTAFDCVSLMYEWQLRFVKTRALGYWSCRQHLNQVNQEHWLLIDAKYIKWATLGMAKMIPVCFQANNICWCYGEMEEVWYKQLTLYIRGHCRINKADNCIV